MVCRAVALKFKDDSKIPLVVPVVPPEYRMEAPSVYFMLSAGSSLTRAPWRRKSFQRIKSPWAGSFFTFRAAFVKG